MIKYFSIMLLFSLAFTGCNDSNLKPVCSSSFSGEMVFVEGGIFLMGDALKTGSEDELPVHRVIVDDFYIGKYEVTVKEYKVFCLDKEIEMPPEPEWGWIDDHPVVNVSWNNAWEYCKWLSEKTGGKYRLLTEAEWEYVASVKGELVYPTGRTITKSMAKIKTYSELNVDKSKPRTVPVGSFKTNSLGIHDLGGNVHEWVMDWYDSTYYQNSPEKNPNGPADGIFKIERGGSWRSPVDASRCSNRHYAKPDFEINNIGFRICLPVEN